MLEVRMLKSKINSVIEIWNEDEVNKDIIFMSEEDRYAKIIQIEHAYDNKYIVEIIK
jgi:hypothetical protein